MRVRGYQLSQTSRLIIFFRVEKSLPVQQRNTYRSIRLPRPLDKGSDSWTRVLDDAGWRCFAKWVPAADDVISTLVVSDSWPTWRKAAAPMNVNASRRFVRMSTFTAGFRSVILGPTATAVAFFVTWFLYRITYCALVLQMLYSAAYRYRMPKKDCYLHQRGGSWIMNLGLSRFVIVWSAGLLKKWQIDLFSFHENHNCRDGSKTNNMCTKSLLLSFSLYIFNSPFPPIPRVRIWGVLVFRTIWIWSQLPCCNA